MHICFNYIKIINFIDRYTVIPKNHFIPCTINYTSVHFEKNVCMVSLYRFNAKIQMSFSINTLGYFLNSVIWLGQCLNQYAKNYRVFISIYMYIHFLHLIHLIFLLAHWHLRWKLKWAFLVTFCLLSVCPYTFHFFNIFSKTTKPISTKLGTKQI